jgi:hypothetical protein
LELSKYIDVDIFGACGTKSCSKRENKKCHEMIKQHYKFYLVFENSKCLGYMTEKLPFVLFSWNCTIIHNPQVFLVGDGYILWVL